MDASINAGTSNPVNYSVNSLSAPDLASLRALFLIALHNGVQIPPEALIRYDSSDLVRFMFAVLHKVDLRGKLLKKVTWKTLTGLGTAFPVLAELRGGVWVIVTAAHPQPDGRTILALLDPRFEGEGLSLREREPFEADWTGRVMLCKPAVKWLPDDSKFGFGWFMPEILKNRHYLRDVAIAAMMSNLISFSTPLFFNVMIDKVIPHHSTNTLMAVALAFVVCTLFDGVFSFLRQSLMLLAGNKIDARLAERTFEHLLRLPMNFFESMPAGVLLRNMNQTEGVRHFLTGKLFQTLLDASGLPLLLIGLAMFSGTLTMVVLSFAAVIAAFIGAMMPTLRKQLLTLYEAEGERQANLVETVHGMRAVKSLGLEKLRKAAWDSKVALAARRRFSVGQFGIGCFVVVSGLQSFMQLGILGVGTLKVFDGSITLGTLIAFNMLSGRVTGPLVQIVQLINEFQQTALSVRMIGKVMDHPPERPPGQEGIRPVIKGRLEVSEVTYTYDGAATPALDRVSFTVEEGQMIGVVGRSGSGKTTITRLLQGIQNPQQGLIKLDGADIRHIDLSYLRRNIGVVLQDNILFRGTIRDNIAAARPDASLDEVMAAATLAGAAEFIERLPLSYETFVEEGATNYSGGQRQRIAIARALLPQPKLLIFDEATSALDPESEAILQHNLESIAKGRTMIIVSHRLSSLVKSDRILVLERGVALDFAPHDVLLGRCDLYRQLWDTQTRHLH